MKRLPNKDLQTFPIDQTAQRIWQDVACAMDHYTNDSFVASFFQPEEFTTEARSMAASFALLHYSPLPTIEEIYKSRLYGLFYLSISSGIQIYIKERSFLRNHLPYIIISDGNTIRETKNTIMKQLANGTQLFSPTSDVVDIFIQQLAPIKEKVRRNIRDRQFDETMFDKILPVTIVWGYLFAKKLIIDKVI